MLKEFENWLLEQNYKPTTALDYQGRIDASKFEVLRFSGNCSVKK